MSPARKFGVKSARKRISEGSDLGGPGLGRLDHQAAYRATARNFMGV